MYLKEEPSRPWKQFSALRQKSVALLPRASKRLSKGKLRPTGHCKVSEQDAKALGVDSLFLEGRT